MYIYATLKTSSPRPKISTKAGWEKAFLEGDVNLIFKAVVQ